MGTQWVVRGRDPDSEEFSLRSVYRPRHARSGRPRRGHGDEGMQSWPSAPGLAERYTSTRCENYGYPQVSIGQMLRDRAVTFVRERSRRYGDEHWPHQSPG
jgi:hypothetical protein